MPKLIDLTGQKFARLTVIERDTEMKVKGRVMWRCKCDCGNLKSVAGCHLRNGTTKSCGCYNIEKITERCIARGDKDNSKYNALYSHYKRNAERRNIPFSLTIDEVKDIIHQPCYYCGDVESDTFSQKKKDYLIRHNGMDRVDPSKGYVIENIVPCCKTCNFAKHIMTQSEFYDWIQRVSNHIKKNKLIEEVM